MLNAYDEESDHSNKAVRKTPEIESGRKVLDSIALYYISLISGLEI